MTTLGRKIAIDASMAMYQFLIAVRSNGPGGGQAATMLTNEAGRAIPSSYFVHMIFILMYLLGEVTSHIQGMFNRTIKMMTCGIKPVYVFDGKPPQLKGGELAKRMARRAKAESGTKLISSSDYYAISSNAVFFLSKTTLWVLHWNNTIVP